MKGFILTLNTTVHKNVHKITFKTVYTPAKLYIPKDKNGNLSLEKNWRVIYRYRNPKTGVLKSFAVKQGLNKLKTISERKKAGNNLTRAINRLLQEGFNPFDEQNNKNNFSEDKKLSVQDALKLAYKEKSKVWSESSLNANKSIYNVFIEWLNENDLLTKEITSIKKKHISTFLNELTDKDKRNVNPVTRNSYRRTVSSLFSQMVNDEIIDSNFVHNIPKLKENPKKNTPFTNEQLKEIKKWCLSNEPYLYEFIKFVMYAFLREVEICRIQLVDIDLKLEILRVKTKTETKRTVLIIKPLLDYIKSLDIEKYPNDSYLFTKNKIPGQWNTKTEKGKVLFFSSRFKKLKENIGEQIKLTEQHTIYSARHTGALNLFHSFKNQGLTSLEAKHKLMTITGHKTLNGLENYLRDIGAYLPENYFDDYTLDF